MMQESPQAPRPRPHLYQGVVVTTRPAAVAALSTNLVERQIATFAVRDLPDDRWQQLDVALLDGLSIENQADVAAEIRRRAPDITLIEIAACDGEIRAPFDERICLVNVDESTARVEVLLEIATMNRRAARCGLTAISGANHDVSQHTPGNLLAAPRQISPESVIHFADLAALFDDIAAAAAAQEWRCDAWIPCSAASASWWRSFRIAEDEETAAPPAGVECVRTTGRECSAAEGEHPWWFAVPVMLDYQSVRRIIAVLTTTAPAAAVEEQKRWRRLLAGIAAQQSKECSLRYETLVSRFEAELVAREESVRSSRREAELMASLEILQDSWSRLDERTREFDLLVHVARGVAGATDLATIEDVLISQVLKATGADYCTLWMDCGTAPVFRHHTLRSGPDVPVCDHFPLSAGAREVWRCGSPLLFTADDCPSVHQQVRQSVLANGAASYIGLPVVDKGEFLGVLEIFGAVMPPSLEQHAQLMTTALAPVALAVRNSMLFESLVAERQRVLEQTNELTVAYEKLRENNRLRSEFVANMSHELRTPLHSIIGYSRCILDGLDGAINTEQTHDLHRVIHSAQNLLSLINDVLDISKLEAGKLDLHLQDADLRHVIDAVINTVHPLARDKDLRIEADIPADLPLVRADPQRLTQVLLNLVGNAIKFTDRGAVSLIVTPSAATGEVKILVRDTGIGIAPASLPYIFDEFRQADGTSTRRFGGAGLGLAIARQLVQQHGSDICVRSEPGIGSEFEFMLPTASIDTR